MAEHSFDDVVDAVRRSGRPMQVRGGQLNTRCGFCGDSRKSTSHMHAYISLAAPHPFFCQRCKYTSGHLTTDVLEALGVAESGAVIYARGVAKEARRSGRSRRGGGQSLGLVKEALQVASPDRANPDHARQLAYLEGRVGALAAAELARYKVVCGLSDLLVDNDVPAYTVDQREVDRLDLDAVGFLSADESYVVFRTVDDGWVKQGGRRYTNYRIWPDWEGSKAFAARAALDLLAPRHHVVACEGVLDLMGAERAFYHNQRWEPNYLGVANNGSAFGATLRMLLRLGVICADVDVYVDREPGSLEAVRRALGESPFFATRHFKVRAFQNLMEGQKDTGTTPDKIRRVEARL
jgi:hypothetical protein